jgi:HK97 gp10 family phage protein
MRVIEITGIRESMQALRELGKGTVGRQLNKALSASGGPLKREAVKRVPVDSGSLKKALIVKVKLRRNKESGGYALVGANRRLTFWVRPGAKKPTKIIATFRQKKDGTIAVSGGKRLDAARGAGARVQKRKPSRYLHLVEGGTKRGVKAQRFLAQTITVAGPQAVARFRERLAKGVEEERVKAASKARARR